MSFILRRKKYLTPKQIEDNKQLANNVRRQYINEMSDVDKLEFLKDVFTTINNRFLQTLSTAEREEYHELYFELKFQAKNDKEKAEKEEKYLQMEKKLQEELKRKQEELELQKKQ